MDFCDWQKLSFQNLVLLTFNALSITMLLHGFLWLTQVYDPSAVLRTFNALSITMFLHWFLWLIEIDDPKCSAPNVQCSPWKCYCMDFCDWHNLTFQDLLLPTFNTLSITMLQHGFLWLTEADHPKCSAPSIQCSLHKNVTAWTSVTEKSWSSKI